jgi:hypothetical protein
LGLASRELQKPASPQFATVLKWREILRRREGGDWNQGEGDIWKRGKLAIRRNFTSSGMMAQRTIRKMVTHMKF